MQIAYPGQPFPKAVDLTEEAMQAQGHLLLNANLAALFTVVGLNGKRREIVTRSIKVDSK
jgi:hypothetical protein